YHKTVVGNYGFIFLKRLETVVTNHTFNFKFKAGISYYGFDHFFLKKFKTVFTNRDFNFKFFLYI
ncbi:hypothetical protein, partial [Vibrio cholerae]|uniref:hypothetical protein n=1 Tax=Vibrio cholerae TaxID=666 RepID=UPI001F268D10